MKKLLASVVMVVLLASPLFAGEVEDLQLEAQGLQQEIQRYQQAIQQKQVRLMEIQGVLKYLDSKETEKKEVK